MRISTFFYTIKQGLKNIWKNKMFSLASIATMTACIFLFGLFYTIVTNFQSMVKDAESGVAVTVFFDEGISQDKMDEISMSTPTSVCEIRDGELISYEITPEQFGYERCEKDALVGGTPQENAWITRDILEGRDRGAKYQAVCLNAGAALYIAGKADTLEAGVKLAEELIDSGKAGVKLASYVAASRQR